MDDPGILVSVVVNSYNQAEYLEQALCSVLDQDYPHIELLVVDGGSSDGSLEVIRRYQERLSWWVSEADQGQADGINKGLRRARGSLVAWLNSDDFYYPQAVSQAVQLWAGQRGAALIYGDVLAVDGSGRVTNRMRTGDWALRDLMEFRILNQPGVFMDRECLSRTGYLQLDYHYLLDHRLWLELGLQGTLVHAPQVWAAGRFHPAAKNVAAALQFGQEAYRITDWLRSDPRYAQVPGCRWARVRGGAHRLNARYLLDGGDARGALQSYWRGFRASPASVLPETHRILYALACMAGLRGLRPLYLRLRRLLRPVHMH